MSAKSELDGWLLEYHKAAYHLQLDRTDKLRDRVSLLISLFTPLGAGVIYILTVYPHSCPNGWNWLFYAPIGISVACFLFAIIQVLYVLAKPFKYAFLPTPVEINNHAQALSDYSCANPTADIDALSEIKKDLAASYCYYATRNITVNKQRNVILIQATGVAILSFACLLLSLPRFFFDVGIKPSEPTKVIIVEPKSPQL